MKNLINFENFTTIAVAVVVLAIALFVVVPQIVNLSTNFGANNAEACCGGGGGGGGGGGDGKSGDVTPARCIAFTANPTTLPHTGGSVTLSWETRNASSVTITGIAGNLPTSGSRTVNVTSDTTFTLTAKGSSLFGNNNDTCVVAVHLQDAPAPKPAAKCDFLNVNRAQVPHDGGNVVLSWGTTNATAVSISGVGSNLPGDGSRTVNVTRDTTFVLTAVGAGGNDDCQVRVTLKDAPPEPAAKCDFFNANRTQVPHDGGNVVLSWGTTNATSVSITGVGSNLPDDGSRTVNVTQNTTFTLTAHGAGGNDSCAVTITLKDAPPEPAAKCDFFNVNDTHLPEDGDYVTLSWGTTNATSVSINNGVGSNLPDDGSRSVFVDDDTTFTLTAHGAGGNDSCVVHVDVEEDVDEPEPRCDFFRVSDDEVEEGDRVTLEWGTTNADDVRIDNGIGDVPDDGDMRVEIDDDTTFRLTARNFDGDEDTCTVRVEVEEEEDDDDDEPRPRCELDISDRNVKVGDEVTLEWETEDAEEVVIKDDEGDTIYREDDLRGDEDGEVEVRITEDTEFTLNAEGDGGERECEVKVRVEEGEVLVLTERDQGKVAGISLTKVPYTGFEAGPMLTFLFYALLTGWAAVVAYMLVIRKDTVLGFSLAGAGAAGTAYAYEPSVSETPVYNEHEEETPESAYAASAVAAPANLPVAPVAIGYASYVNEVEETDEETETMKALEDFAHSRQALFSSDALRVFSAEHGNDENAFAALDEVIATAKASYPTEDGWIVVNLTRLEEVMQQPEAVVAPTIAPIEGTGSLAEAIVTGNIVAAYRLIENRPMLALADAAAELDAVNRMYEGTAAGTVTVSELLKAEVAKHSINDLKSAIDALTGALDGTYTDEESAVKMAIMKATKAFSA